MEWYHPHLVWIFSPQPNLEFLTGKAEVCSYSDSIQISCHRLFHWLRPRPSSLCHVKYPPFLTQFSCHCAGLVQYRGLSRDPTAHNQPAVRVAEVWLELLL